MLIHRPSSRSRLIGNQDFRPQRILHNFHVPEAQLIALQAHFLCVAEFLSSRGSKYAFANRLYVRKIALLRPDDRARDRCPRPRLQIRKPLGKRLLPPEAT